jgi:hypothetical protein
MQLVGLLQQDFKLEWPKVGVPPNSTSTWDTLGAKSSLMRYFETQDILKLTLMCASLASASVPHRCVSLAVGVPHG